MTPICSATSFKLLVTESVKEIPANPSPYPILYGLSAVLIIGNQPVSVATVVAGATVSFGVASTTATSSSALPPQAATIRNRHKNMLQYFLFTKIVTPSFRILIY